MDVDRKFNTLRGTQIPRIKSESLFCKDFDFSFGDFFLKLKRNPHLREFLFRETEIKTFIDAHCSKKPAL